MEGLSRSFPKLCKRLSTPRVALTGSLRTFWTNKFGSVSPNHGKTSMCAHVRRKSGKFGNLPAPVFHRYSIGILRYSTTRAGILALASVLGHMFSYTGGFGASAQVVPLIKLKKGRNTSLWRPAAPVAACSSMPSFLEFYQDLGPPYREELRFAVRVLPVVALRTPCAV